MDRREHGLHMGQGECQRHVPGAPRNISRCSATAPSITTGGWRVRPRRTLPWELSSRPPPDVITGYKWELYNVMEDPTASNDLAVKMPNKLKQIAGHLLRRGEAV